jgi:hypothetical protein
MMISRFIRCESLDRGLEIIVGLQFQPVSTVSRVKFRQLSHKSTEPTSRPGALPWGDMPGPEWQVEDLRSPCPPLIPGRLSGSHEAPGLATVAHRAARALA